MLQETAINNTFNFETLTVSNTVKVLTSTKYFGAGNGISASSALISVDGTVGTDGVRWTTDGTAPVAATTGHMCPAGQSFVVKGSTKLANLKMIRESASDTKVQITYFGG